MPCGPHITLLRTLEYGHLDHTSDHPTQGVRAPSTPRLVAHCSSRSDLRALAHEQNSDLLHPISFKRLNYLPAEDSHVAYVAHPIHYRPHELLRLGPKAPRNLYTKWDEYCPSVKSRCARSALFHRARLSRSPSWASLHGVYGPTALPLSLWSFHAMRVSIVPVASTSTRT